MKKLLLLLAVFLVSCGQSDPDITLYTGGDRGPVESDLYNTVTYYAEAPDGCDTIPDGYYLDELENHAWDDYPALRYPPHGVGSWELTLEIPTDESDRDFAIRIDQPFIGCENLIIELYYNGELVEQKITTGSYNIQVIEYTYEELKTL